MSNNEQKTLVLAGDVGVHDPLYSPNAFDDNDVCMTLRTIESIEELQKSNNPRLRSAADSFVDTLAELARHGGNLYDGVPTRNGGMFRIIPNGDTRPSNDHGDLEDTAENRVLWATKNIAKEECAKHGPDRRTILVSKKVSLRTKAEILGIHAQDYQFDMVKNIDALYTGFTEIDVSDDIIQGLHSSGSHTVDAGGYGEQLAPNTACFLRIPGSSEPVLALYKRRENVFLLVQTNNMRLNGKIRPRNPEQWLAFAQGIDQSNLLNSFVGIPGTGKTAIACLVAYELVTDETTPFNRIIAFRPTNELGNELGFRPGDLEAKFWDFTTPIFGNMEIIMGSKFPASEYPSMAGLVDDAREKGEVSPVNEWYRSGKLQIRPINFIQGETFNNCVVILDEAQNTTFYDMRAFLTRLGQNCKMILCGDLEQATVRSRYFNSQSSGLANVIKTLPGDEEYSHLRLVTSERHPFVQRMVAALG